MSQPPPDALLRAAEQSRTRVAALRLDTPGHVLRARLGSPRPGGRLERPLRRGDPGRPLRLLCALPPEGAPGGAPAAARRLEAAGAVGLALEPGPGVAAAGPLEAVRAATALPLLPAEVVVDEYQLLEAAALGADGALLAAALLSQVALQVLVGQARMLGLDPLVMVRDHDELARALAAGATLVGVGDPVRPGPLGEDAALLDAPATVPPLVTAVAWCEAPERAELARLRAGRCDAVRVGPVAARSPDPAALLAELARG